MGFALGEPSAIAPPSAQFAAAHWIWSYSMEPSGMDLKAELEGLKRKNAQLEMRVEELQSTKLRKATPPAPPVQCFLIF